MNPKDERIEKSYCGTTSSSPEQRALKKAVQWSATSYHLAFA